MFQHSWYCVQLTFTSCLIENCQVLLSYEDLTTNMYSKTSKWNYILKQLYACTVESTSFVHLYAFSNALTVLVHYSLGLLSL